MKIFNLITLAVMGLMLVNCDNSKSTVNDIKQKVEQTSSDVNDKIKSLYDQTKSESEAALNKFKEGNYSLAQDEVIKVFKQNLPVVFDENTTLVDLSKGNNIIDYKYAIKGITKDVLQNEDNQKARLNNLLTIYCGNGTSMAALRLIFPDGASHNYYINDEKVLTLDMKPSDCKENSANK